MTYLIRDPHAVDPPGHPPSRLIRRASQGHGPQNQYLKFPPLIFCARTRTRARAVRLPIRAFLARGRTAGEIQLVEFPHAREIRAGPQDLVVELDGLSFDGRREVGCDVWGGGRGGDFEDEEGGGRRRDAEAAEGFCDLGVGGGTLSMLWACGGFWE